MSVSPVRRGWQRLERGDADFGEEGVDIAGDEEPGAYEPPL